MHIRNAIKNIKTYINKVTASSLPIYIMYSKILIFDGITLADIVQVKSQSVEKCAHPNIMADLKAAGMLKDLSNFVKKFLFSYDPTKYIALPALYTTVGDWPTSSNLLCWNCHCTFDSVPMFIPNGYSGKAIKTLGNFCRLSCAMKYLISVKDERIVNVGESRRALYIIQKAFFNTDDVIEQAPSFTTMRQYCGNNGVTAVQYREKS